MVDNEDIVVTSAAAIIDVDAGRKLRKIQEDGDRVGWSMDAMFWNVRSKPNACASES